MRPSPLQRILQWLRGHQRATAGWLILERLQRAGGVEGGEGEEAR